MSIQNGERLVTKQDLADMYQGILPYLGGMPEMLANKFSKGDLYSTDEKMIGQWIDGKPLYQRTIRIDNPTFDNTNKQFYVNFSNVQIDTPTAVNAYYASTGDGVLRTLETHGKISGFGVQRNTSPVPNSFYIQATESGTYSITIFVTIQYTKVNDTAISIGEAIDYSTDEKVVGTWIDSKPLYQKTVSITMPNTNSEVDLGLTGIENIVKITGTLVNNSGAVAIFNPSYGIEIITYYNTTTNRLNIAYSKSASWVHGLTAYVTIQYTKATT